MLTRLPFAIAFCSALFSSHVAPGAAPQTFAQEICTQFTPAAGFPVASDRGSAASAVADRATGPIQDARRQWSRADIRDWAVDRDGRLWVACRQGAARYDRRTKKWHLFDGRDGLPVEDLTCVAAGGDGSVWFGSQRGAVRYDGEVFAYRAGKRWLPDDDVRAIEVDADGTAWIATAGGVSRIERRAMTFGEKAAHYESMIDARHRRFGYVTVASLARPGDLSEWTLSDTDNDGLWTAMYGAGECFRYAVTKEPAALKKARDAFAAMNRLHAVTGIPGFPARSVLPASGPDPNRTYTVERDRDRQKRDPLWKVISPRWPKSADGKWYWKCDTSSDEIDGHYFFYAMFHDHAAATPEEKAKAAGIIKAMTDHILAHDFFLVDHDGKPTRWGVWNPAKLNCDIDWLDERGLNSLEMLSFLATAHHVTGDEKYLRITRELVEQHHYAINLQTQKVTFPPGDINHSDDEMAFLCYYLLIRYTKDEALLALYRKSLTRSWRFERPERNPLFNFIYGACTGRPCDRDLAVDTLRRMPWSLVDWRMTNRHRKDIDLVREGLQPHGAWRRIPLFGVLPIDERYVQWWNHNPYTPDTGGAGRREADGAFFLLPYHLGRYHGFVR